MNSNASRLEDVCGQTDSDNNLFRKITWRIFPILWLGYFFNYLDRTNIAYAQLQMKGQLGFSDAVFGLGASIVFVGLIAFEIPSNILLARIGIRKTLFRIMMLWGVCSAAMCFVKTPTEFYVLRFLIGMFEAGLAPGVLYYLTLWYPNQRRGQPAALFYTAPSFARIVSGPLAGVFMTYLNGAGNLQGWQWMFIMEGLPCVILAIAAYTFLADSPDKAHWLNHEERFRAQQLILDDSAAHQTHDRQNLLAVMRDPRLWVLSFVGFLMLIALFGLTFWQPTLLKGMGLTVMQVGMYSVLPALCGVVASIFVAKHSDATGERCWHFTLSAVVAAVGLLLTAFFPTNVISTLLCLCLAWAGMNSAYSLLWALPGRIFSGKVAATGIGIITVIQGSAGIAGPYGIALIKVATGGFAVSLYIMSGLLIASALLFFPFFAGKSELHLESAN